MRALIPQVYRSCLKASANQTFIIGSKNIEKKEHRTSASSRAGETDAKIPRENPDSGFPTLNTLNTNLKDSEVPVVPAYVLRVQKKIIEFESAKQTSKMARKVDQRPLTKKDEPIIFYFDLETSGLDVSCDILQISVRSRESHFTSYITPTKPIDEGASRVNNLYFRDGKLFKGDQQVETLPLDDVLQKMLDHLTSFNKKCLLVAHYCPFDSRHLLQKLRANSTLFATFKNLLYGFADSYEMFAEKYPERRWVKGTLTLSKLVEESLGMSTANAHDAGVDTLLLQKLVHHHFTDEEIFDYTVTLAYALENRRNWSRRKRAF